MTTVIDQIAADTIRDRIQWDTRISNSDLRIKVKNGIATITGALDSEFRHQAALAAVSSTQGIRKTIDSIKIEKFYHRSDRSLLALIQNRLFDLPLKKSERIEVTVNSGRVTLGGVVNNARFKAHAAVACWELSGVKDCSNQIEVSAKPSKELRAELQKQKFSSFNPLI